MAEVSFDRPKVARGRLTNYRTGNYVEFLYNPTSISKKQGVNLSEDNLPGSSDPLVHFASGKARSVTFSLQLCGESSLRLRGANLTNAIEADVEEDPTETLSIAGEIEFYESFTYPVDPELPGSDGGCDKLVFTFGRTIRHFLCVMEELDVNVTQFTPSLQPYRATLNLTLKRVATETTFADRVFAQTYEGYKL